MPGARTPTTTDPLKAIARQLLTLERRMVALEQDRRGPLAQVAEPWRDSARNLVHYVALRQLDLRQLQLQLARAGLSSLGRSEGSVLHSVLQASLRAHESLALRGDRAATRQLPRLEAAGARALSGATARQRLHEHTRAALGPQPVDRHIAIMVTAPPASEATQAWMETLLRAGMNVLRVNCAHEQEPQWRQLVHNLELARTATGLSCRVLMDLAGPKVRTGAIDGARRVTTWKPTRDELGRVAAPARVELRRGDSPGAALTIGAEAFALLRPGDELRFQDTRDKKRVLEVLEVAGDSITCSSTERAWVLDRVVTRLHRGGKRLGEVTIEVGEPARAAIDVRTGDPLRLTRRAVTGTPPTRRADGTVQQPGVVACTLPAALDHLARGDRVVFDDGRIHAVVEKVTRPGEFLLRVVRTWKPVAALRAEKGINLPDTRVTVPSLDAEDRRALAFAARHADAVGLSFVRSPEDVRGLHRRLDRLGRPDIAVVLKIETREGFQNLPRLLLEGLRRPPLAVMIARGDLAIELGFERLAEVQEQILWLCEAAHVPSIWATQVLDTLARTGVPSRAEITDAAASVAAECVMLNKGPFVHEAVSALSRILRRMEKHRDKKRSLFRKLGVSSFAPRQD